MDASNNTITMPQNDYSSKINEKMDMIIAKLIICRKKKHITQKELAILSGVPEVAIARLESYNPDYRLPRIDTILKLAFALDIDVQLV